MVWTFTPYSFFVYPGVYLLQATFGGSLIDGGGGAETMNKQQPFLIGALAASLYVGYAYVAPQLLSNPSTMEKVAAGAGTAYVWMYGYTAYTFK